MLWNSSGPDYLPSLTTANPFRSSSRGLIFARSVINQNGGIRVGPSEGLWLMVIPPGRWAFRAALRHRRATHAGARTSRDDPSVWLSILPGKTDGGFRGSAIFHEIIAAGRGRRPRLSSPTTTTGDYWESGRARNGIEASKTLAIYGPGRNPLLLTVEITPARVGLGNRFASPATLFGGGWKFSLKSE